MLVRRKSPNPASSKLLLKGGAIKKRWKGLEPIVYVTLMGAGIKV